MDAAPLQRVHSRANLQDGAPEADVTSLDHLPDAVLLDCVLASLPLEARAAACCVCRRLRDLIYGDAGAWASLDLGALLPGRARRVTDDVLASLAHRARGGLTRLDVSGATEVSCGAVAAIACANPGLCELRAAGLFWSRAQVFQARCRPIRGPCACHGCVRGP